VRIAIDIDSTLHHYWDQLSPRRGARFGVDLPYEDQVTWDITLLRPEQVKACVRETHGEKMCSPPSRIRARWRRSARGARPATSSTSPRTAQRVAGGDRRWLDDIGLPYDELYCSEDKVSHCTAIGIDILIDDSPENLERALDAGMVAATILHPWNRELCETEDVVHGETWEELARNLETVLR
jgi:FMN phosphatase YigB (HAD superfamily)